MSHSHGVSAGPLVAYFVLAYAVSWGAIVTLVGVDGLATMARPADARFLPVVLAQLAGPVLAGLVLVSYTRGRPGLRELWRRQRRVRLSARWYAIAVLTTPLVLVIVGGSLWAASPTYAPAIVTTREPVALVGIAVGGGLFVAAFEELGWTGYALPALRSRYRLLTAGLLLGLLWGAWHGLADFWGNVGLYGGLWPLRIGLWILALTAYRIVIVWVHEGTTSLFLAQLAHASFVAGQALMEPEGLPPGDYLLWYGLFAAMLWVVVGVIWAGRLRAST